MGQVIWNHLKVVLGLQSEPVTSLIWAEDCLVSVQTTIDVQNLNVCVLPNSAAMARGERIICSYGLRPFAFSISKSCQSLLGRKFHGTLSEALVLNRWSAVDHSASLTLAAHFISALHNSSWKQRRYLPAVNTCQCVRWSCRYKSVRRFVKCFPTSLWSQRSSIGAQRPSRRGLTKRRCFSLAFRVWICAQEVIFLYSENVF